MEAKDTVLPVGRHNESIVCPHCGEEFGIESKVEYERELQSEISFKAGRQEVVEWIDKNCLECQSNTPSNTDEYLGFHKQSWQAQLKLWFKNNPELLKDWGLS